MFNPPKILNAAFLSETSFLYNTEVLVSPLLHNTASALTHLNLF